MFKKTVAELKALAQRQAGPDALAPVQAADARTTLLLKAVTEMAKEFGVELKPLHSIDANGELRVVAVDPCSSVFCGYFNGFSKWLQTARPRTGVTGTTCKLDESSGWCLINHFEAERMVLAYADTLQ